ETNDSCSVLLFIGADQVDEVCNGSIESNICEVVRGQPRLDSPCDATHTRPILQRRIRNLVKAFHTDAPLISMSIVKACDPGSRLSKLFVGPTTSPVVFGAVMTNIAWLLCVPACIV